MPLCVLVNMRATCQALFLEHDSKGSTFGLSSWNHIKPTGDLPLPNLGTSTDMYVRELLPQASSHLLPGLFEQNGNAESHSKAKATAVSWPKDTYPHGVWHNLGHIHFEGSSHPGLSTTGVTRELKCCYSCITLSP